MPTITVSDRVLDRIRSLRQAGEATDEEVLGRLLDQVFVDRKSRLRAYEMTEQDIQSTN